MIKDVAFKLNTNLSRNGKTSAKSGVKGKRDPGEAFKVYIDVIGLLFLAQVITEGQIEAGAYVYVQLPINFVGLKKKNGGFEAKLQELGLIRNMQLKEIKASGESMGLKRRFVGLYRRVLPSPPAIDFASSEGKFSLDRGIESAYCGLATLAMVLNALSIDPGRKWKGPWRWFDESMLDCCGPLEKVKAEGISFGKVIHVNIQASPITSTPIHPGWSILIISHGAV
ncbi:hypothetical protein L2E82_45048 [Cichorium intybus]|uniref:Uncharacterized protein n=1 Tax=Cichorium intybus TaxID=13427 RepID=A0ACB8ZWB9_CICIN|nr:hypothetical protein L2E82_45048 [Cichorium intybus]